MLSWIKLQARTLKTDAHAVYFAARNPRGPWFAKALAVAVAAYALSPIDLIPDFIPVLGYVDDLIIVPLGIWLVIRLIPDDVMADLRATAAATPRPSSRWGIGFIILLWLGGAAALGWIGFRRWAPQDQP